MQLSATGSFSRYNPGEDRTKSPGEMVVCLVVDDRDPANINVLVATQWGRRDRVGEDAATAGEVVAEVRYPSQHCEVIVRWNGVWQPEKPDHFAWMTLEEIFASAKNGEVSQVLLTALGVLFLWNANYTRFAR